MSWVHSCMPGPLHPRLSTGLHHTCPLAPPAFPYTGDVRLLPALTLRITAPRPGPTAAGCSPTQTLSSPRLTSSLLSSLVFHVASTVFLSGFPAVSHRLSSPVPWALMWARDVLHHALDVPPLPLYPFPRRCCTISASSALVSTFREQAAPLSAVRGSLLARARKWLPLSLSGRLCLLPRSLPSLLLPCLR